MQRLLFALILLLPPPPAYAIGELGGGPVSTADALLVLSFFVGIPIAICFVARRFVKNLDTRRGRFTEVVFLTFWIWLVSLVVSVFAIGALQRILLPTDMTASVLQLLGLTSVLGLALALTSAAAVWQLRDTTAEKLQK